jgi:hypothetical protein
MTMSEEDPVNEVYANSLGKREKTREELLVELLKSYKTYVVVGLGIYTISALQGWLPVPNLAPVHWYVLTILSTGYFIAGPRFKKVIKPHLEDPRVPVAVTEVGGRILDIFRFPRAEFGDYDIQGSRFPERQSMYGNKVLVARAVDWGSKVLVPGGEFPGDDRYPDDPDLLGEDADGSQVQRLKEALLEDAERGRLATRDEVIQREKARQEAVNDLAVMFQELRSSEGTDLEEDNPDDLAEDAEKVIRDMAIQQQNAGGSDE